MARKRWMHQPDFVLMGFARHFGDLSFMRPDRGLETPNWQTLYKAMIYDDY